MNTTEQMSWLRDHFLLFNKGEAQLWITLSGKWFLKFRQSLGNPIPVSVLRVISKDKVSKLQKSFLGKFPQRALSGPPSLSCGYKRNCNGLLSIMSPFLRGLRSSRGGEEATCPVLSCRLFCGCMWSGYTNERYVFIGRKITERVKIQTALISVVLCGELKRKYPLSQTVCQ